MAAPTFLSTPARLASIQIVQLDSLGAPERLEVTARLLLDLREQLHPVQHPVKVSLRGAARYSAAGATAAASSHMWQVTLYSLQENPTGEQSCVWGQRYAAVLGSVHVGFG